MEHKGWIALDIDGTITTEKYSVPKEVIAFLREQHQKGWNIVLATGRPFAFGSMALTEFDFPYFFLAQNGSIALEMPAAHILFKRYLTKEEIPLVEKAYEGIDTDFLIYAGYERGDICYWRPRRFSSADTEYLLDLQKRQKEAWKEVEYFKDIPAKEFPLIKCFGPYEMMKKVSDRLLATGQFQVSKIRDPFTDATILLVTDKSASKGASLKELFKRRGRGFVVAAGDDENDISLLQAADCKIAMPHAPARLKQEATFIAERGIVQALQEALKNHAR